MSTESSNIWRKCTTCKKAINYNTVYWVCTVSTCNSKRAGMAFCSMDCWDVHLPVMNHREAFAEQRKSPASLEAARKLEEEKKKTSVNKQEASSSNNLAAKNSVIIRRKGQSNPQS